MKLLLLAVIIVWFLPSIFLFALSMFGIANCEDSRRVWRRSPVLTTVATFFFSLTWPRYFVWRPWKDRTLARQVRRNRKK